MRWRLFHQSLFDVHTLGSNCNAATFVGPRRVDLLHQSMMEGVSDGCEGTAISSWNATKHVGTIGRCARGCAVAEIRKEDDWVRVSHVFVPGETMMGNEHGRCAQ